MSATSRNETEKRVETSCLAWELFSYRDRTLTCLRRYFRMSIEIGRLPSILGREFFRAKVTSYRMTTFEDAVIFVHDMEKALEMLDKEAQHLIARIIFEEYSQDEVAEQLKCSRKTIGRQLPEALDRATEIFLRRGLLETKPPRRMRELVVRG